MLIRGLKEKRKLSWLMGCILVTWLSFLASLTFGQTPIRFSSVVESFFYYQPDNLEHLIVQTERFSRAIIAMFVGASLAVSGVLVQAITKNPLASPSILGINSGAVFFLVITFSLFTITSINHLVWAALLGSLLSAALVYLLGSSGNDGASPLRIVLAGAAISALFLSCTQALLIINNENLESVLFWLAGSVSNRELETLLALLPLVVIAFVAIVLLTPHINLLMMNDDVAVGLGQNVALIKILAASAAIVLAASAVSIAGLIGFIGLVVPHISRRLIGLDHRWLIPASALIGASLLLIADVISRFVVPPQELPVGVMTAIVGAPFFIHLARKQGGKG